MKRMRFAAAAASAAAVFCILFGVVAPIFAKDSTSEKGFWSADTPVSPKEWLCEPQYSVSSVYQQVTGQMLKDQLGLSETAYSFSTRAVWFSYLDWQSLLQQKTKAAFESAVGEIASNCQKMGLNTIILQLRAFGDAFYPSDYYPWSAYLWGYNQAPDYDPLTLFLEAAARYDLRVEGWINPFRLTNTQNLESLPADSPLGVLYRDGDHMKQDANGIWWLNPADAQAVSLICDGIKELCENYALSAIQFDDYFYSGVSPQEFGQTEKEAIKALSNFISKVGKIVHRADLSFGISPQGNISADLTPASDTKLYTDLKSWCDKGWIDYLMPQLYYGFSHQTAAFETLLQRWKSWLGESDVQLMFGLASYKCGTVDSYAGSGENEWLKNDSIIADQVSCLAQNAAGFSLFRYSSLMLPENETAQAEQEALKALLH